MQDINIIPEGVHALLSKLDSHKANGPDNIPAHVLKETTYEITPMLTHLFQQSLDTGDIPHDWRSAWVTPIYKKGQWTDPQNYRPVSLTSIVCKTLEHILSNQITYHLESNDIISTTQFGFRNKHSCESQLLITVDDFAKALNSKKQVDIGILDFSKAFDRVSHARLAKKLDFYGINGKTLSWIQSFLNNQQQNEVINGVCSSSCVVTSTRSFTRIGTQSNSITTIHQRFN